MDFVLHQVSSNGYNMVSKQHQPNFPAPYSVKYKIMASESPNEAKKALDWQRAVDRLHLRVPTRP